ncbi:MAG: hypothetical protein KC933_37265, partial [Myxococcales bacterium]|nr:hypothetical protein [Myxococcales bacterium]
SLVALSDPRTPAQTITPDVDGVYAFSLVVSDGVATSAPAVVRVGVGFRGSPPVASAGPDLEVLPGLDVELDGTGSADSDGDPLTYQWRVLHATGGQANLANATLPRAQLVQPVAGVYTIELTVNDGFFNATDTAVVTVAMDPTGVVIGVESCTTGGNILVLNGDRDPDFTDDIHLPHDYIHPGLGVYTSGGWTASALAYTSTTGAPKFVQVNVTTTSDWWSTEFSTTNLDQALVTGSYPAAMRFPFEDLGHPGLGIHGDGRGCNRLVGEFEIHELETSTTADPAVHTLERFTATFTQHCEEGVAKLTGCVHYRR